MRFFRVDFSTIFITLNLLALRLSYNRPSKRSSAEGKHIGGCPPPARSTRASISSKIYCKIRAGGEGTPLESSKIL